MYGHLLCYLAGWFLRGNKSVWLFLSVFLSLVFLRLLHHTKMSFALACSKIGSAIGRIHVKETGQLWLLFK